jgi:glycosyltransferase involved in cell wall biosynthesis
MNIKIIINTNPFYAASASANRWLSLIQGLSQLGVEIKILVIGNYQSAEEKEKFGKHHTINNIEVKYLTSKVTGGLWQRRYHNYIGKYLQLIQTKSKIKKELVGFEGIVWAENDLEIWKVITGISNKCFKLIAEMSEFLDIHHYNKGNILQRKLADAKQNYFENHYVKSLDGFILMTKTLMTLYEKFSLPDTKLLQLPMTVDLDRFNHELAVLADFQQPYIAFVGVMNDAKDGVNILIEAFAEIHKQFPKHKLYLIGAWNYDTPNHQKLIQEYHLQDKVYWKGEYSRDKIPQIIKNACILALPRPDSKQAQGGFPTKLGEYLATANPVCATTVGEIPDYLVDGESVFFAEPGSVASFAKAMQRALNDLEEAKRIGENGRGVAETNFNKDIQSNLLYNFLKEL